MFFNEKMDAVANGPSKRLSMRQTSFCPIAEQIMHWRRFCNVEGKPESRAPDEAFIANKNNVWRGGWVTPYSANIQWDLFKSQKNRIVLRWLKNVLQRKRNPAFKR